MVAGRILSPCFRAARIDLCGAVPFGGPLRAGRPISHIRAARAADARRAAGSARSPLGDAVAIDRV
jgi:hypothetical protein